nr:ATP-binding protein [Niveibacterium umoris]
MAAYTLAVRSFDALRYLELSQIADAVARHGIERQNSDEEDQPGDFLSQVWGASGKLLYTSHSPAAPRPAKSGEVDFHYDDRSWHGFVRTYQGQTILVARESGARRELFERISLPLLTVLAGLTLLLTVILGLRVSRALAPLSDLRAALSTRDPASLNPLPTEQSPRELLPLVGTLNHLLERIGAVLDGQRRFIADAAHELRTPVTAIRLYAQLAQRAETAQERDRAIANIEASCTRAAHLVEQLLALARLDPDHLPGVAPVRLDTLARDGVVGLSALAEARHIDLGLGESAEATVQGSESELRMLINNLIDNAVRYTPAGGQVDVSVAATASEVALCVEDSGPGIPPEEHERVFERFRRLAGADQPGTGLGLAIVKNVAERHGAQVRLENRAEGGLRVRVVWPLAA